MQRIKKKNNIDKTVREMETKNSLNKKEKKDLVLIHSGSTLLDLACSDSLDGAFEIGTINTIPGASQAGKTVLLLTIMAMMRTNEKYHDYDYIFDNGEVFLNFNFGHLFASLIDKETNETIIKPPNGYDDVGLPKHSKTVQDFEANILTRCKKGKPFIYGLDSLDSLSSDQELVKAHKKALARAKTDDEIKEAKGSYNMEKAKILGMTIRMINNALAETNSILFIVQQIRAKVNAIFGDKTTTSGGYAPFFYSNHQIWMQQIKQIKHGDLEIGNKVKVKTTKNKLTGKKRIIEFDIYSDYGIDDIGSMVDYLVKNKHWRKTGKKINAKELNLVEMRTKLISEIEKKNKIEKLKKIVERKWKKMEEDAKLNRKPRF